MHVAGEQIVRTIWLTAWKLSLSVITWNLQTKAATGKARETGGDETIKVEMDLSRMFTICQQVTETFLQLSRSPDDAADKLNAALAFCDFICKILQK